MLAGVWTVYLSFGAVIGSTAALVPAIRADLELSRGQMGLVLGAWQFVYLGVSVPAGKLIDRLGLRWSVLLAGLSIALSAGLRSAAQGLPSLLLAVAVFGIGGPLISIGAPKMVAEYFAAADRRTAVGIYGTGPAIGAALGLAGTNGVLMPMVDNSWRAAMATGALLAAAGAALWMIVSVRPGAAARAPVVTPLSTTELLRLPIVRLVLILGIGGFFYSHAVSNWLVDILEDAGWSVAATSAGVLASALAASGLTRSIIMPLCVLILMDSRAIGSRNMAAAGGLFFTAAEIGGVLGPLITGVLADLTDGFGLSIVTLSAALVAMAALVFLRLRPMLAIDAAAPGEESYSASPLG